MPIQQMMQRPLIGITTDIDQRDGRRFVRPAYAERIAQAGGVPVILAPDPGLIPEYQTRCAGFVLTGGDDPIMEDWGVATHPKASRVHPDRQRFERALLTALDAQPETPVLGICLGMQYMALHAGGAIDQHLPDSMPEIADSHWGKVEHDVALFTSRSLPAEQHRVLSHHRQAVVDTGSLATFARSVEDGLIEGVADPARPFYIGVQWHPERTGDNPAGNGLFRSLIDHTQSHLLKNL